MRGAGPTRVLEERRRGYSPPKPSPFQGREARRERKASVEGARALFFKCSFTPRVGAEFLLARGRRRAAYSRQSESLLSRVRRRTRLPATVRRRCSAEGE